MTKGEIIDIFKVVNEFGNISYRVVVEFEEIPKLMLGNVEVKQ